MSLRTSGDGDEADGGAAAAGQAQGEGVGRGDLGLADGQRHGIVAIVGTGAVLIDHGPRHMTVYTTSLRS